MPNPDEEPLEFWLRDALDLDQEERNYLASLNLASPWRQQSATVTDARWGWLALIGVVTAFITWSLAGPIVSADFDFANRIGLSTFVVTNVVEWLGRIGETFIGVATAPGLTLSQPLLAVVALAVLFWPRLVAAPHFLQGVRS